MHRWSSGALNGLLGEKGHCEDGFSEKFGKEVTIVHMHDYIQKMLLVLLALCLIPAQAFALELDRTGSLSVQCEPAGQVAEGAEFRLYRVADISAEAQFALAGDFVHYPVQVNGLDSAGWRALADTLAGYVASDGVSALRAAATDGEGVARFDALQPGLYLLLGDVCVVGGTRYTPSPALVSLPNRGAYDVQVNPKYEAGEDEKISLRVVKVWNDGGHEDQRPAEITVQLLGDGKVVDTVRLSAAGNWRHTWADLDPDVQWQVVETLVPQGYQVSVEREGDLIIIKNTSSDTGEVSPPEGNLPQTGQLWWPVSLLAAVGMALFVLGWARRKRDER